MATRANLMEHTFVICAYGDSPFLEACIQSCLNQLSVKSNHSKVVLYTSTPSDQIEILCQRYQIELLVKRGGGIGIDWNNALSVVDTK